jgi:hypothetical protein
MKNILCLILIGVSGCAWGASSELGQASVTLPYSELASLLDRVHEVEQSLAALPPKPPVDVLVRSAHYQIDYMNLEAPQFEASFEVSNLSDQWQSVMLVEATSGIRSVEPPDAKLAQREGGMHLLLEPGAESQVTLGLQLAAPQRSRGGQMIADFFAIAAAQSSLTVQHSGNFDSLIVTGATGTNLEKTEFILSASGGTVQVKLYDTAALLPTRWRSEAQYLVHDAGGAMEVTCHLRLMATDGGRTNKAALTLPNEVSVLTVDGIGFAQKSVEMTDEGSIIHLNWPSDDAMVRELSFSYSVPISMAGAHVVMPLLEVADAVQSSEAYYFIDFDGIALRPAAGPWSVAGRIPDWIEREVGAQDLDYYAVSSGEALELSVRLLPRLKTGTAIIKEAAYNTEVVAEGGRLNKASITIEHGAQADYEFKLPEGGKLLACDINGRPSEPIIEEDGSLRLIMPRTRETMATTHVGYTFTTKGEKMNSVEGKAHLELPRTPLFIHKLTWTVALPSEYQATALEGNVVIDAGGAEGKPVSLSKQIYDDETPVASLYYTRRDLQQ